MAIEKVREYFKQYGMEDRILEMEHGGAGGLGCGSGTCKNCENPVV